MTRLKRSHGGFIRSLQMSTVQIFAFVEGRLDRPFFDRLLTRECSAKKVGHRIIAMKELPGGTGGKAALIATFQQFRKKGLLKCQPFGKKMACVFFADKDADDFTRKKLRSAHFVYSLTYDLEGHLFGSGDLTRALADSCGITLDQSRDLLPDTKIWLESAATNWRDWIALCLISQANGVNCGCTFDRISSVNPDPFLAPDSSQVAAFKIKLGNKIGITHVELDKLFVAAIRSVDRSIAEGHPLRYFKGKWLNHLVQKYLEGRPRIPDALISGVGERLGVSFLGQISFGTSCRLSAAYLISINNIIDVI